MTTSIRTSADGLSSIIAVNGVDRFSIDQNGKATATKFAGLVEGSIHSGTAIATTSGTAHDYTSIPEWVERITLLLSGVSTNGSSNLQVQFGSGSIDTSGYIGSGTRLSGGSTTSSSYTAGVGIPSDTASATNTGRFVFENLGSNVWEVNAQVGGSNSATYLSAGGKSLSGALDRIRLTTVNGTDLFDAGQINILYE